MNAVAAESSVLVDLTDRVKHTFFLEGCLLGLHHIFRLSRIVRIREDPVLGEQSGQLFRNDACVSVVGHCDCRCLIRDWNYTYIDRHRDARLSDHIKPSLELLHVPAQLRHDVIRAIILFLLEEGNVRLNAPAGHMAFRRTGDRNRELVTVLLADELDKLGRIMQVSARTGPADREVAAQGKHVVDSVLKIGVELLPDTLFCVSDAGEVSQRDSFSVLFDFVENFEVLAYIGPARSVGAGNIVGSQFIELVQNTSRAAQFFHSLVCFRREYLK